MALEYIDVSRREQKPQRRRQPQQRRRMQQMEYSPGHQYRQGVQRTENRKAPGMTPAERQQRRERMLRRRKRRRRILMIKIAIFVCMMVMAGGVGFALYRMVISLQGDKEVRETIGRTIVKEENRQRVLKPNITEDFLTVNPYSRPGEELGQVNNIFVHYTANKRTSAAQNRSYFENLGQTGETSASAHFIIGYEGEIIQCIPLGEIGYAVVGRNYDSVSIECCYLEEDGEFTEETYSSLVWLCAWLLQEYDLAPEDIFRHYDEGGKKCPLYYVEHEDAWRQFIKDVENRVM